MSQPTEIWRPVVGYEGSYEVSNQGRVRSLDRMVPAGQGRMRKSAGRVLSAHFDGNYERVRLTVDAAGRTFAIHGLVARAFLGPCPDGMEVCHNDGNSRNNTPQNLRYDTRQENVEDIRRHGRVRYREDRFERCARGHEYQSEADYYISTEGVVKCLACDRAKGERYRAAKRGGKPKRSENPYCAKGHLFDGIAKKSGGGYQRTCSTCAAEWRRKRKERKTAHVQGVDQHP